MPTRKPVGWSQDAVGRRRRVYDVPATPLERLLTAGVLSPRQARELVELRGRLNPAEITRDILRYQDILIGLSKAPTQALADSEQLRMQRRAKQLRVQVKKAA